MRPKVPLPRTQALRTRVVEPWVLVLAVLIFGTTAAAGPPLAGPAGSDPAPPVQAQGLPLMHLDLRLDPAQGRIEGQMRLPLTAGVHEFHLIGELEIEQARADGQDLPITRSGPQRYRLELDTDIPVSLSWSGGLPDGDPMRSRLFLGPDGGFLPPESGWYPRFEDIGDVALRLSARVPASQRFVATGSLVEEPQVQGHYSAVFEHPRVDAIVLATGPWAARTVEVEGVQIRTLFPETLDREHAQTYLDHTAEYLVAFNARAGAYPYRSFTIAASPMPVGFAFPGFTLLGERVIPLPFIPRTSLAHELMHNWWGTGVRVDYDSGNWSEALTTFMADYYLDERRGQARETRYRWLLDSTWIPPEREQPLRAFSGGSQGVQRVIGYNRGALMFHMLRERIGDPAFDAGTRLIRDRHLFEVTRWADLERAFSDAAGEDLAEFFSAWVDRPGIPELAVHSVTLEAENGGWVLQGVLEQVQDAAAWPLRVPVVVGIRTDESPGGEGPGHAQPDAEHRHTVIEVEQRRTPFRLGLDAPPISIAVDPDYHLLRRLPDPPTILRTVTLDPNTRLIATQAGLEPLAQRILEQRPATAQQFDPDRPLLLLGSTDDVTRWLEQAEAPQPPEPMAQRGHARMWTLPGTRTVVVSAEDGSGLVNLVATLRHHGHRSYVVQDEDGRTRDTGVWPAQTQPLRIELTPDGT